MRVYDLMDPDMKKLKIWREAAWNRFETARTKDEASAASFEILQVNIRIKQLLQKRRMDDASGDNKRSIAAEVNRSSFSIRNWFDGIIRFCNRGRVTRQEA